MTPFPPAPDTAVEAVCTATYYADLVPACAFVFRLPATDTRFTVYARDPRRYAINGSYTVTISDPDHVPLWLPADDAGFLHHCLGLVEQRWRDAIAEADAGGERASIERGASPGRLNVEPTPAGYRAIADRFRVELRRVQQLHAHLDQLLPAGQPDPDGDPM
jgi:hypothetical protein